MDETRKKLIEEIESVFNTLSTLSPDTEKYNKTVDNLTKLYELYNADKKIELEYNEKEARREMEEKQHIDEVDANFFSQKEELDQKNKQHKFEIICFIAGTVLTGVTFIGDKVFHGHWMKKMFMFEEKGSISGGASRGVSKSIFDVFKHKGIKK